MRRALLIFVLLFAVACSEDTTGNQDNNTNNVNNSNNANNSNNGGSCDDVDCGELTCVEDGGLASCECPAGTTQQGDSCIEDTTCQPTTCNDRGECMDTSGGPVCECQTGFTGEFCDACDTAAGYVDDGQGGCTDDPCSLVDCRADQECVVENLQGVCECEPGTSEQNGVCEPDATCMPNTCAGNGTCTDTANGPECACDEGWAGASCGECDALNGYHPDGAGGCTTDLCLPNPCTQPNETVCDATSGVAECSCDAGYHDEGGTCVIDEVCDANSCNGQGTCTTPDGQVDCQCNTGYVGDTCDQCDAANGYRDDGQGGCTNDPCLPNPCMDPNKTQCATNGQSFVCSCDPGYHDDGAGGCTMDPCLPNICAATNQACRDDGNGQPECYTPTCNDNNPCTDDVLVQGVCQYNPITDGSPCSTSACVTGEVCTAGVCGGGTTLSCDDGNPCTDDSCDMVLGCQNDNDDTNVPDDGIACTTDSCSGGFASNTPNTAACDDGLFCNGDEVCLPSDPQAGADGCVTTNVPQPTGPSLGPCAYYVCDEGSDSFSPLNQNPGASCNDGIYCTTGDVCNASGQCQGTLQANCPADPTSTTCASTHSLGSTDIVWANLDLTVTYEGQDPEVTLPSSDYHIFAVEKETGAWIRIADYSRTISGADKQRESVKILPGTYDILYSTSTGNDYTGFSMSTNALAVPEGIMYLDRDVTFYAGPNTYSLDVDPAAITVNVTYEGQDPEITLPGSDYHIFAVEKDTGAWVRIADYSRTISGTDKQRESVLIMPGTYDILYSTSTGDDYTGFSMSTNALAVPEGIVYLQKNVTIGEGEVLNFDVDPAAITVNVTYEGQDPEVTLPSSDYHIFAVEQDTGAWIRIADYSRTVSGTDKQRESVLIMPGTYDILYSTSTGNDYTGFSMSTNAMAVPEGIVHLQKNVTIGENEVLNFDVNPAAITVNVTYEGQDPEVTLPSSDYHIFAVEQDTGAWIRIADYSRTVSGTDKQRESVLIMPGTYDILYSTSTGNDYTGFSMSTNALAVPEGIVYLQKNVTIGEGEVLNIDVDPAAIAPLVTVEGIDPEVSLPGSDFHIFAVERETGAWVRIVDYSRTVSGADKMRESVLIMPGTYDILYSTSTGDDYTGFSMSTNALAVAEGIVYLDRCVAF